LPRPLTQLPVRPIGPADAWCEDPGDRRYNRPFRRSASEPGDRLWRGDRLYDIIVEIDHNVRPRIAGRGSAVFVHVARPGFAPTAGCIALKPHDLRMLVRRLSLKTRIMIHN
jgi:L,D-peptidoglycan transpeptidase YkuD (ErfK/YbiS/YcfS/YnhG family)